MARKVFSERSIAVLALFITTLATPFWNNWASRAGTGYVEATTVGSLMILMTLIMSSRDSSKRKLGFSFFGLGLLGGLGFWIQPTIIYYLIPVVVFLALDLRRSLLSKSAIFLPLGFVLGDLPVLTYNFTHSSATAPTLFKIPWGIKSALGKLIIEGFPVILGTRTSNSRVDFFTPIAIVIEALAALSVLYFSYLFYKHILVFFKNKKIFLEPRELIFIVFLFTIFVFLLSTPFNQFSIEPRYVFSLYSTLPLLIACFLFKIGQKSKIFFLTLLFIYILNWGFGLVLANPLTFNDKYKLNNLISYLTARSIGSLITDQALGHRIMFLADLSIISAVRGGGITEWRFPSINLEVIRRRDLDNFSVSFAAVKDSPEAKSFEAEARGFLKDSFRQETIDNTFVIIEPIRK